jgi:hypothetical protein
VEASVPVLPEAASAEAVPADAGDAASRGHSGRGARDDSRPVGALYTWNGNWGQRTPEVAEILRGWRGSWTVAATRLRQVQPLTHLFASFWQRMREVCEDTGHQHLSCALEVSTRAVDCGRVHLHAFMTVGGSARGVPEASTKARVSFQEKPPSHTAPCKPGRGLNRLSRAVNEGHYYLQAEKHGSVFRAARALDSVFVAVAETRPRRRAGRGDREPRPSFLHCA